MVVWRMVSSLAVVNWAYREGNVECSLPQIRVHNVLYKFKAQITM